MAGAAGVARRFDGRTDSSRMTIGMPCRRWMCTWRQCRQHTRSHQQGFRGHRLSHHTRWPSIQPRLPRRTLKCRQFGTSATQTRGPCTRRGTDRTPTGSRAALRWCGKGRRSDSCPCTAHSSVGCCMAPEVAAPEARVVTLVVCRASSHVSRPDRNDSTTSRLPKASDSQ